MRRAILICAPEVLRDGLGPIFDHGLKVEGSLFGFREASPAVVLAVSGDVLPIECGDESRFARVVEIIFTREAYGSQSLTRVSEIRLSDRDASSFQPEQLPLKAA